MKKEIVMFGTGKIAEVISHYATQDCGYKIAAFTVDEAHLTDKTFNGVPVVPFEKVETLYPPESYDFFVAIGYHDMNRLREKKSEAASAKKYKLASIVSPVGLPQDLKMGDGCFVSPGANVHPRVELGRGVFVWSGALVGHHSKIGDYAWLTSSANTGGGVEIGARCFLALGCTVGHSVKIGRECFLGANTLVTKNLDDQQVAIVESTKPLRLTTDQFLKMSNFKSL